MLALVMGAIAYYRRSDRAYVALAAAAGAYALHGFSRLVVEPPWSDAAWDAWLALTAWSAVGAVLWLLARLRLRRWRARPQATLLSFARRLASDRFSSQRDRRGF